MVSIHISLVIISCPDYSRHSDFSLSSAEDSGVMMREIFISPIVLSVTEGRHREEPAQAVSKISD